MVPEPIYGKSVKNGVLLRQSVVCNYTNNQNISVVSGVNFDFSKSIPDFYTADCLDLPFFCGLAKIKITENA